MQQSNQGSQYDLEPPRKPGPSAFTWIAVGLGGLILVSFLCLGVWYVFMRPGQDPTPGPTEEKAADTTPSSETPIIPSPIEPALTTVVPTMDTPVITITFTPTDTATAPPTVTTTFTPTFTATLPTLTPTKDYFAAFPDEFKVIQLPEKTTNILDQGGLLLLPPREPAVFQKQLLSVANNYHLSRFDLNRVVNISPQLDYEEYDYVAVPTSPEFYKEKFGANDFSKGVLAGLIYDKDGAYSGLADVYEIWVYEDHVYLSGLKYKSAILLQETKNEYFWVPQAESSSLPLLVFVKNGCWLCWRIDKRCGCVICK